MTVEDWAKQLYTIAFNNMEGREYDEFVFYDKICCACSEYLEAVGADNHGMD